MYMLKDSYRFMQRFSAINIYIWMLLLRPDGSFCLRNVHILAPEAVEKGASVEMRCHYDLEQETLYSVKWYRGDREFCRYSPREVPPLKVFPIPGIDVDKESSDERRLTLRASSRTAGGRYTCEVSADSPSFQTAQVHATVHVVELPSTGPVLKGMKARYRPGSRLRAECVSRDAMPPANLSFFINSEPALSQHVWRRVEAGADRLMTAFGTIQFVVQPHYFVRGKIKIRCTAHIYGVYVKSVERSAEEERARPSQPAQPEQREAVVFPVHRPPDPADASPRLSSAVSLTSFSLATSLCLPTVLR